MTPEQIKGLIPPPVRPAAGKLYTEHQLIATVQAALAQQASKTTADGDLRQLRSDIAEFRSKWQIWAGFNEDRILQACEALTGEVEALRRLFGVTDAQADGDSYFDLFEDICAIIKFGKLTMAEEHKQLSRLLYFPDVKPDDNAGSAEEYHKALAAPTAEGIVAPWSKSVESAALLLNRATDLPLDDCESLAGTILGMAAKVQPKVMANGLTEAETAQTASVFGLTQAPAPAPEPAAWVPYLSDRADGVAGHYALARWNPAGYREVWNLRNHRWASASDDVLCLEEADSLLRQIVIPTVKPAPVPQVFTEGHCAEKRKPGGCQLHNLHCGYPACDRKDAVPAPAVGADDARDAARYRWLRDGQGVNWDVLPVDAGNDLAEWRCTFHSPYGMHDDTEDSLDAAVDTAMASQPPVQGNGNG